MVVSATTALVITHRFMYSYIGHIKHRPLILDVSHPNTKYMCSKQYILILDVSRQTNLTCGSSFWTDIHVG